MVDPVQNIPRVLEPEEQRSHPALLLRRKEVMPPCDCARSFAKSFCTQHFAANRADELFASTVARTAE
jgi:hypothetical protein